MEVLEATEEDYRYSDEPDEFGIFIRDLDNIPTSLLRHAFAQSELNPTQVASNLGWIHSKNKTPDSSRFLRTIGIVPMRDKNAKDEDGCVKYRRTVGYDMAVKIIEGLHYDPVDFGL